jgi:DNA polymerase I-like protein with 3'-5' exonuclease and polymerase domains
LQQELRRLLQVPFGGLVSGHVMREQIYVGLWRQEMLIDSDVKALEVCCAAFLSEDKVLTKELLDGIDIHSVNQRAFNLPDRLIAKKLVFRILYGGTEFSFVKDPEFFHVSNKIQYWYKAINNFYEKYNGLYNWHNKLVSNVILTGLYRSPTGREYRFVPYQTNKGEWKWPRTNILNYPVQGFGADLMAIFRVSLWNRIKKQQLKVHPIATVHDSVLLDAPKTSVDQIVTLITEVARDIPGNFLRLFGVQYTLPFEVEIKVGNDYLNMKWRK